MGLLDQLANQMLGGDTQRAQGGLQTAQLAGLAQAVIAMLGSQQQGGQQQAGLGGLLPGFQRAGLDGLIQSWISTGQNQAISGTQLRDALGSDRIDALSRQAGVSPDQGIGALAQLLPSLIDQLTPDGQVPDNSQIGKLGANLLRSLMK
jgi:uncharacterized protein YidB (DUF937 family)